MSTPGGKAPAEALWAWLRLAGPHKSRLHNKDALWRPLEAWGATAQEWMPSKREGSRKPPRQGSCPVSSGGSLGRGTGPPCGTTPGAPLTLTGPWRSNGSGFCKADTAQLFLERCPVRLQSSPHAQTTHSGRGVAGLSGSRRLLVNPYTSGVRMKPPPRDFNSSSEKASE